MASENVSVNICWRLAQDSLIKAEGDKFSARVRDMGGYLEGD